MVSDGCGWPLRPTPQYYGYSCFQSLVSSDSFSFGILFFSFSVSCDSVFKEYPFVFLSIQRKGSSAPVVANSVDPQNILHSFRQVFLCLFEGGCTFVFFLSLLLNKPPLN